MDMARFHRSEGTPCPYSFVEYSPGYMFHGVHILYDTGSSDVLLPLRRLLLSYRVTITLD